MHTFYSDGHASHAQIAQAALRAGLDAVIVTDHNVLVNGFEGYYQDGQHHVLLLVGEEVHNQARQPQKSHLLVFGATRELAPYANDPQTLIERARQYGGLTFLAHIVDPPAPVAHQEDLSWVDWDVEGFTGIELWNGFSELKTHLRSRLHAIFYAYNFNQVANGPLPDALRIWDELLSTGKRVVAIGGSDAHAIPAKMGPLKRVVFPYEQHFRAVNTHLLLKSPLTGEIVEDKRLILDALKQGHAFIGYDLPGSTRGFRFTAKGREETVWMGDMISAKYGVTLQIRIPAPAECRLIKDGKLIKSWRKNDSLVHNTPEPGVYRVEVFREYLGKLRGWIYSNPIYVTP